MNKKPFSSAIKMIPFKYIGLCIALIALVYFLLPKTRMVPDSYGSARGVILDRACFTEKVFHFDHFHNVTRSYLSIDSYPYYLLFPYNIQEKYDDVSLGDYVDVCYAIEEGAGFFVLTNIIKVPILE